MSLLGRKYASNSLQVGLALQWSTEQTSGTNEPDFSPNGRDGVIAGATLNIAGHKGNTYTFDGVNDDIDVVFYPAGAFSVSQWPKVSAYQVDQVSWSFNLGGNDDQNIALVPYEAAGAAGLRLWWGGSFIIDANGLSLDTFHNIIFTSNGSNLHELFADGVSVGTSTAALGQGLKTNFTVGQYGAGFFIAGEIGEETKIWDKILTQDEIDNIQLI